MAEVLHDGGEHAINGDLEVHRMVRYEADRPAGPTSVCISRNRVLLSEAITEVVVRVIGGIGRELGCRHLRDTIGRSLRDHKGHHHAHGPGHIRIQRRRGRDTPEQNAVYGKFPCASL